MTSDMGEMFNEHRKERAQKRRDNTVASTDLLRSRGIPFESLNFGVHLRLKMGAHVIDFWPGTGLWHYRTPKGTTLKRRGVFRLIKQWESLQASAQAGPEYAQGLPF